MFKAVLRIFLLFLGMSVMTLGICLITKADLGTTPISTVPLVLAQITELSFGQMTVAVNVGFVLIQMLLLRRDYRAVSLLQIPVVFVFGQLLDFWMAMFNAKASLALSEQWTMNLLGNLAMALGIVFQVHSKTIVQPGEGLVLALSIVTRKSFATLKSVFDVILVMLAVTVSWSVLGQCDVIGPGTLVSALLVGSLIGWIQAIGRYFKQNVKRKTVRFSHKQGPNG